MQNSISENQNKKSDNSITKSLCFWFDKKYRMGKNYLCV